MYITSSEKGKGREEILDYIYDINREIAEEGKTSDKPAQDMEEGTVEQQGDS